VDECKPLVVGWKLSHRLPFTLPSDDGSGGAGAGPHFSQLNLLTDDSRSETQQYGYRGQAAQLVAQLVAQLEAQLVDL